MSGDTTKRVLENPECFYSVEIWYEVLRLHVKKDNRDYFRTEEEAQEWINSQNKLMSFKINPVIVLTSQDKKQRFILLADIKKMTIQQNDSEKEKTT